MHQQHFLAIILRKQETGYTVKNSIFFCFAENFVDTKYIQHFSYVYQVVHIMKGAKGNGKRNSEKYIRKWIEIVSNVFETNKRE